MDKAAKVSSKRVESTPSASLASEEDHAMSNGSPHGQCGRTGDAQYNTDSPKSRQDGPRGVVVEIDDTEDVLHGTAQICILTTNSGYARCVQVEENGYDEFKKWS